MTTRAPKSRQVVPSRREPRERRFRQDRPGAPRLALSRAEAAGALGISVDSFERYVQPEIRLVRRGTLRLVPVAELQTWLGRNASMTLDPPG